MQKQTQQARDSLPQSSLESLESLYLDPNNYRIIDAENYVKEPEKRVLNQDVQRRTYNIIVGKNAEHVRDLIDSFRENGFLPIDQIQVRRLGDSSEFLVVEGNRRIAALKYLQSKYEEESVDLGRLDPALFSKVPVVYYTDTGEGHHLVLMGLKHISGNKKWPTINQAELIRTLHIKHGKSLDEASKSLGISKREAGTILETLSLIDIYRDSDYGDQFESSRYTVFGEIVRNQKMRAWLKWDKAKMTAGNAENLDRLFSWISKDVVVGDESDDEQTHEAIVAGVRDVRELAKIIDDEKALDNLESTRSLSDAALSSSVFGEDKAKKSLAMIDKHANVVFGLSEHVTDADREDIEKLIGKLRGLAASGKTQPVSAAARPEYLAGKNTDKFTRIDIAEFRGLRDITLAGAKTVNVVAGINNSGKTTILEAVRLLCSLTSTRDFLSLVKSRGRVGEADPVEIQWFVEQLPRLSVRARFAAKAVALRVGVGEEKQENMAQYLNSARLDAAVEGNEFSSRVHFFENYLPRAEGEFASLCPSVSATPFSALDMGLLLDCHSKSLKEDSKDTVIEFLREHIDRGIKSIELDDRDHFIVTHDSKPSLDLTMFGDGLQRIFKIGLLFACAEDGVVLIDEFENAIHVSLLAKLPALVHALAKTFNTQVFISSHSKECIDAFSSNIPDEDVSFYGFTESDGAAVCRHFSGERLHVLLESIDFDLRGGVK